MLLVISSRSLRLFFCFVLIYPHSLCVLFWSRGKRIFSWFWRRKLYRLVYEPSCIIISSKKKLTKLLPIHRQVWRLTYLLVKSAWNWFVSFSIENRDEQSWYLHNYLTFKLKIDLHTGADNQREKSIEIGDSFVIGCVCIWFELYVDQYGLVDVLLW